MAAINVGKQIFEGTSVAVPDMEADPEGNIGRFNAINQPQFKSAAASLGNDVGEMISGAAKAAVNITETSATNALQRKLDPIMEDRTRQLEEVNASLLSPQGTELPDDIKNHEKNIKDIVALKPLVTGSDYHARILMAQKETRAMYPPAFRPFIDSTTDRITKLGHANEYMGALTANINAAMGKANAEREKLYAVGIEAGKYDPEFSKKVLAVQANQYPIGKMYIEANEILARENQMRSQHLRLQTEALSTASRARIATD